MSSELDEAVAAFHRSGLPRAEWLAAHPHLAAELADYFAALDDVEEAFAPLRSAWLGPTPEETIAAGGDAPALSSVGEYDLLRELGRGGMGVVFEARHRVLGRRVALKMLLGGVAAADAGRLRREAEAAARLDHPDIVPVLEAGEHDGLPYFTMKLVGGESLAEHLPRFRADPRGAAALVARVARAVHHAHERGVLHRDIKPSNVLIDAEGRPYVTDFGLAFVEGGVALTGPGAIMGTPAYMAPEQLGGATATTSADVHGLGALLYALLTGRPPFHAADVFAALELVRSHPPAPPSSLNLAVPRDLDTICLKCLEKDPARRYPSADELADDLDRWLRGDEVKARPAGVAERLWRWARRSPARAALAGLGLALAALLALSWRWAVDARSRQAERARELARSTEERFRLLGHAVRITAERPRVAELLAQPAGEKRRAELQKFLDETRTSFNQWFTWSAHEPVVNWFVLDRAGTIVADSRKDSRVVDQPWRDRDYARLLDPGEGDGPDGPDVAAVFRSGQDKLFKFAVAAPVLDEQRRVVGVLAASVPVSARLLGLDLADHPEGAFVAGPSDPTYDGPVWRWAVALSRAHVVPGLEGVPVSGEAARLLDAMEGLGSGSRLDGGDVLDAVRVGDTRYVAVTRHPLPWPMGLLPPARWLPLSLTIALGLIAWLWIRRRPVEKSS